MKATARSSRSRMEGDGDAVERVGGAYAAPDANQRDLGALEQVPGSSDGVTICYRVHGSGPTKLLLIPGLACGHAFWRPYIRALTSTNNDRPDDTEENGNSREARNADRSHEVEEGIRNDSSYAGIQLCTFDNRGVGSSSIPMPKSEYSTTIMAKDALAIMDHLGWQQAHLCGHSMGGMIALKLAAIAPSRVLSLTLISVTGGGFECLPKIRWKTLAIAYRFFRAKTLEQRVLVDLDTHYTKDFLDEKVGDVERRRLLFKEYVKNMEAGGIQPKEGLDGHMHACWTHEVKDDEIQSIRSAGILIAVIHGKYDLVARVRHARNLAKRLGPTARMVELSGGHLVTHQNTDQVVEALLELIRATASNVQPSDWSKGVLSCSGGDESVSPWSIFRTGIFLCLCILVIISWILIWSL